jgi:predicted transcriptional regulator
MAYTEKKLKALEMRKAGMSYSQIKKELEVSKSTLSLWLRQLPLSPERIRELLFDNEQRIERFRNTMQNKRVKRLVKVYKNEKVKLLPLSREVLYVAGLMLYWGEGGKTKTGEISLSNTDPRIIAFYHYWLTEALKITKDQIFIKLHLYADMDYSKELTYWSQLLDIPTSHFKNPYVKTTTLRGLTYKSYGHGTCKLIVYGAELYEKVMMGIKCISDSCLKSIQTKMIK